MSYNYRRSQGDQQTGYSRIDQNSSAAKKRSQIANDQLKYGGGGKSPNRIPYQPTSTFPQESNQDIGKNVNQAQKAYYSRQQNSLMASVLQYNQRKNEKSESQHSSHQGSLQKHQQFKSKQSPRTFGNQSPIQSGADEKSKELLGDSHIKVEMQGESEDNASPYKAGKYSLARQNLAHRTYQKAALKTSNSGQNLPNKPQLEKQTKAIQIKEQQKPPVPTQIKQTQQQLSSVKSMGNLIPSQKSLISRTKEPASEREVRKDPSGQSQPPNEVRNIRNQMVQANDKKIKEVIEYANTVNQKNKVLTDQYYKIENQRNNLKLELHTKQQQLKSMSQKLRTQKSRYDTLVSDHKKYQPNDAIDQCRRMYEDNVRNMLKKYENLNLQLRGKTQQIYEISRELSDANNENESLKNKNDSLIISFEKHQNQLKIREGIITKKQTEIQQLKEKNQKVTTRCKELQNRISGIRVQMNQRIDQLTSNSSNEKDHIIKNNLKEISSLKNDLNIKDQIINNLETRTRQLMEAKIQKEKEVRETISRVQQQKNVKIKSYEKILTQKDKEIEKAKIESMTLIVGSQSKISLKSRDGTVQDLVKTHSGQLNSITEILNLKVQETYELKSELINWKSKNNNLQNEINSLKAKIASSENNAIQKNDIELIRANTDVQNLKKKLQANIKILESKKREIDQKDNFIRSSLMGAVKRQDLPGLVKQLKDIFNLNSN